MASVDCTAVACEGEPNDGMQTWISDVPRTVPGVLGGEERPDGQATATPAAKTCARTVLAPKRIARKMRARVAGKRVKLRGRKMTIRMRGTKPARAVFTGRTKKGKKVRIVRRVRAC